MNKVKTIALTLGTVALGSAGAFAADSSSPLDIVTNAGAQVSGYAYSAAAAAAVVFVALLGIRIVTRAFKSVK
jgi:7-keto-8-aminopelargonate synthetase-like enzyme